MTNALSPRAFRQLVRCGQFAAQTAGQCPGYTQGNLAIMPGEFAEEFLRFASRPSARRACLSPSPTSPATC